MVSYLRHVGLLFHTTALIATVTLFACATPDTAPRQNHPDPLKPWSPTRAGDHPGELAHPPAPASRSASDAPGPLSTTAHFAWRLYSATLSRTMGETCRFSPSCSRFAVEALAVGPEGVLLAFARLQRSHDEHAYPLTPQGYLLNPPRDYHFWRSPEGVDAHQTDLPSPFAWYVFHRATHGTSPSPTSSGLPAPDPPADPEPR